MNLINEMNPCFDKVTSITDSKEFVQSFCTKALALLTEFKLAYSKAIDARRKKDLEAITHKISSTMEWLDLDDFVALIKSYKTLPSFDKNSRETLLNDVMHNANYIENSLKQKIAEL